MTTTTPEAPSPPWVELFAPTSPETQRLLLASNAKGDPAEAFREAFMSERLVVIQRAKTELNKLTVLTAEGIVDVLDAIWRSRSPALSKFIGPSVAEAYAKAFREANQGNVPIRLIYSLAEQHVQRTGDYFHKTSSEALVQGFNTFVNRQVPPKAALNRVLDGFGMTPRQMSGLTSAKYFENKVENSLPRSIKTKVRNYIAKSITDRLNIFSRQESHNLSQQAQQVSWMWMVEHGKLPKTAEKMWITAQDERVCGICGPLHRAKVPVGERFILDDGQKLYVPGAHTNCRCKVRLQIPQVTVTKSAFGIIEKANGDDEDFDPKEHPRGAGGRFVRANSPEPERQRARAPEPQPEPEVAEREAATEQLEEITRQAQKQAQIDAVIREELLQLRMAEAEQPAELPTAELPPEPTAELPEAPTAELQASVAELGAPTAELGAEEAPTAELPELPTAEIPAPRAELAELPPAMTGTVEIPERTAELTRRTISIDIQAGLRALAAEDAERAELRPVRYTRPGVRDYPRSMYTVVDYGKHVRGRRQTDIPDTAHFAPARDDLMEQELQGQYDEQVAARVEEMIYSGTNKIKDVYPLRGDVEAVFPEEVLTEIINNVARNQGKDRMLTVTYSDPNGVYSPVTAQIPMNEAAELMDINREDFEVVVLKTDSHPISAVKETEAGANPLFQRWRAPGTYEVGPDYIDKKFSVPVRIIEVTPVAEKKRAKGEEEGDPEATPWGAGDEPPYPGG